MENSEPLHMEDENDILEIRDLKVVFPSDKKTTSAVSGISLSLEKGSILGLVGESGSGKSVTSLSILGLTDKASTSGTILFRKKDGYTIEILSSREKETQKLRGSEIAMIFQEPGSALTPVLRVGKQLEKVIRLHDKSLSRLERHEKALKLLRTAGFREAEKIWKMFPHELSGGMKQRVVIAIALSSRPELILADEPTTALDATIQGEILELLGKLVRENGVSMILISHDLGIISRMADTIAIMHNGKIMEEGLKDEILQSPIHPYTIQLLETARNKEKGISTETSDSRLTNPDPSLCPFYDFCHANGKTCADWTPDYIHITPTHRVSCLNLRRNDE